MNFKTSRLILWNDQPIIIFIDKFLIIFMNLATIWRFTKYSAVAETTKRTLQLILANGEFAWRLCVAAISLMSGLSLRNLSSHCFSRSAFALYGGGPKRSGELHKVSSLQFLESMTCVQRVVWYFREV